VTEKRCLFFWGGRAIITIRGRSNLIANIEKANLPMSPYVVHNEGQKNRIPVWDCRGLNRKQILLLVGRWALKGGTTTNGKRRKGGLTESATWGRFYAEG